MADLYSHLTVKRMKEMTTGNYVEGRPPKSAVCPGRCAFRCHLSELLYAQLQTTAQGCRRYQALLSTSAIATLAAQSAIASGGELSPVIEVRNPVLPSINYELVIPLLVGTLMTVGVLLYQPQEAYYARHWTP